jgi:hypothetical protein
MILSGSLYKTVMRAAHYLSSLSNKLTTASEICFISSNSSDS